MGTGESIGIHPRASLLPLRPLRPQMGCCVRIKRKRNTPPPPHPLLQPTLFRRSIVCRFTEEIVVRPACKARALRVGCRMNWTIAAIMCRPVMETARHGVAVSIEFS